MKLLVKSLAGGNFHLDVEPSQTVAQVKESIKAAQGHEVEQQKLIFSGKILSNEKTLDECGVKEKDFLVVMVSKPKAAKPAPKAEASATAEKEGDKPPAQAEAKPEEKPAQQPAEPAPAGDVAQAAPSAPSSGVVGAAGSFLSGSELEAAMNSMQEMGFPQDKVQRAMRMSFNNPDRAVEYLMNGTVDTAPIPPAPASGTGGESGAGAGGDAGSGAGAAPAQQAQQAPASGNLFEQAAAAAGGGGNAGGAGARGAPGAGGMAAPPGAEMLPGEDDGHGRQVIDLGNPQILAQLRTLVEQNPAALQPLIQALVQTNPQLAEALSADPEGVLRLLAGSEGLEGFEGEESFEVPTLQQLSEEDRTNVEQIIAMGIPENKAIESYFMCGKNVEIAVQYYFDNPGDFED